MPCAPLSSELDDVGSRTVQTPPFVFLKDPEPLQKTTPIIFCGHHWGSKTEPGPQLGHLRDVCSPDKSALVPTAHWGRKGQGYWQPLRSQ